MGQSASVVTCCCPCLGTGGLGVVKQPKAEISVSLSVQAHVTHTPPRASIVADHLDGLVVGRKLSNISLGSRFHGIRGGASFRDQYRMLDEVAGSGGFAGEVRKVERRGSSQRCVERCAKFLTKHDEDKTKFLRDEVAIYLSLDHPHIARLLGVYEDDDYVTLVMEYCRGGTLLDRWLCRREAQPPANFPEAEAAEASVQMFAAVNYMHCRGVAHRDLKLQNVVYSSPSGDNELKLIDFGFSRMLGPDEAPLQEVLGTLRYMAPELFQVNSGAAESYSEKCDIWSLGICIYMLLAGEMPFDAGGCDGYTKMVVGEMIRAGDCDLSDSMFPGVSAEGRDSVRGLLVVDPSERPSAAEALAGMPWLQRAALARRPAPDEAATASIVSALDSFAAASELSRLAQSTVAYSLSSQETVCVNEWFGVFDRSFTGAITMSDFSATLAELQPEMRESEVNTLFHRLIEVDTPQGSEPKAGELEAITYSHFVACFVSSILQKGSKLMPLDSSHASPRPHLADEFEEAADVSEVASSSFLDTLSGVTVAKKLPYQPTLDNPDLTMPVGKVIDMFLTPTEVIVFPAARTTAEVIQEMAKLHVRSVVVRAADDSLGFFDYMDVSHQVLKLMDSGRTGQDALAEVGARPVGEVVNASKRSNMLTYDVHTPIKDVLQAIVDERLQTRRVPIVRSKSTAWDVVRVFNSMDFLQLFLHHRSCCNVLDRHFAQRFESPSTIVNLSARYDESLASALRRMDSSKLTLCPVIDAELSDDLGSLAMWVLGVEDIKVLFKTGEYDPINMSVVDFLAWRGTVSLGKTRYPYVSVDSKVSLRSLALKLLVTGLQRIFLTSAARVVGVVSARDMMKQVWQQALEERVDPSVVGRLAAGHQQSAPQPSALQAATASTDSLPRRRSVGGIRWADEGLTNDAGVPMRWGIKKCGAFYCSRYIGLESMPGGRDGYCGPNNGPQCVDCRTAQERMAEEAQ